MMKRFICLVALVPSTGTLLTACNTARASAKIFSIFYHAISRAAS
ncbi:entericidin A [Salmonella enterica subsp. enterica serovar Weltevreden]|nr:entericidin A [Salmonella enterica subsp. enterica serovar Weltevreden]